MNRNFARDSKQPHFFCLLVSTKKNKFAMLPTEFDAQRWIVVVDMDACPHSKKQVATCKDLNLNMKGGILCNDPDHKDSEACMKVPAFPCFCNVDSNICVAGLRETREQFDELQRLSNEEVKRKRSQK